MKHLKKYLVQLDLNYPDLDYQDFSIIRTCFSGPVFLMNINKKVGARQV